MPKKIVVVGSINLDLVAYVPRMPDEGETLTGNEFATYPGGKGANQAVAAARLGGEVVMIGRVGQDDFGKRLLRDLTSAGVDTQSVLSVEKATGSAVILVNRRGSNSIVVIPGANAELKVADLEEHVGILQDAGVILAQLEIPMETVERLGEIAATAGVPFILDPAPAQALSPDILRNVTWLTPNESEANSILRDLGFATGDLLDENVLLSAAEHLLAAGARNVILKLGGRGVYLAGKDVAATLVAPYHVEAVDTTAAGDAFNGGFAFSLAQGRSPVESARFACAVAAISVTRAGAQPSMPTLAEVKALMEKSDVGATGY